MNLINKFTLSLSIAMLVGCGSENKNEEIKTDIIQPEISSYEKIFPSNYVSFNTDVEETDFTLAASKTINAVVHIKNTSNYIENSRNWLYNLYGESAPKKVGSGSGVIISPDGYIITNDHVIDGAAEIEVTINNNQAYKAILVGSDPYTDIAVLKIDPKTPLNYIPFGNSEYGNS